MAHKPTSPNLLLLRVLFRVVTIFILFENIELKPNFV